MERTHFDLLVNDGELKRVPFEVGKTLNPIGIFPKAANFYLKLNETDYLSRAVIPADELPTDEELRVMIGADINLLNENLQELNAPIISGRYAVKDPGTVAIFEPHDYMKLADIGCKPVKARCCGRL